MNSLHTMGIILAVVIHGAIGGGAYAAYEVSDQREYPCSEDTLPADAPLCDAVGTFRVIEATLAALKEDDTKQPQKKKSRKKSKSATKEQAINKSDPNAKPTKKPKRRDDEVSDKDINSILKKNRQDDEDDNEDDLDDGKPTKKTRGQFHGHKHGFADVSKGDPYLQKLAADVYNRWKVPTLETGKGATVGCIRIEPDGSIKATKLHATKKSGNQRLDASVSIALKKLQKFRAKKKKEVPTHLSKITTEWLCFKFQKKAD